MELLASAVVLQSLLLCFVSYRLAVITTRYNDLTKPPQAVKPAKESPTEQEAPISFVSGSDDVDDEVITTVMSQEDLRKFNGLAKDASTAATTTPTLVSEGVKKA